MHIYAKKNVIDPTCTQAFENVLPNLHSAIV